MLLILSATANYQRHPESLGTCHVLEGRKGEGEVQMGGGSLYFIEAFFVNITVHR